MMKFVALLSIALVGVGSFTTTAPLRTMRLSPSSSTTYGTRLSSSTTYADGTRPLIEGDYKKVFLAGGTRGVGRLILDNLVSSGIEVITLARNDEGMNSLKDIDGVTVIPGDAFDYKTVEDNMFGCDVAVSTLSGVEEEGGRRVDYTGSNNVIEAAGILGITRVVLVSSIGCGSSKSAISPDVYSQLEPVLIEKTKAENVLIKYYTNTAWTIVRPGGLKTAPASGTSILTEDEMAVGSVNRQDVAGERASERTSEGE